MLLVAAVLTALGATWWMTFGPSARKDTGLSVKSSGPSGDAATPSGALEEPLPSEADPLRSPEVRADEIASTSEAVPPSPRVRVSVRPYRGTEAIRLRSDVDPNPSQVRFERPPAEIVTARIDEQGVAAVADVPQGEWNLVLDVHGYQRVEQAVRIASHAGSMLVRIGVEPLSRIRVHVLVDFEGAADTSKGDGYFLKEGGRWSREPLIRTLLDAGSSGPASENDPAVARLVGAHEFWRNSRVLDHVDEFEVFEFPPLYVRVQSANRLLASRRVDSLQGDVTIPLTNADLEPALGSVRFRLVDREGAPVSGEGSLTLTRSSRDGPLLHCRPDPDGVVVVDRLFPGSVGIHLQMPATAGARLLATIRAGADEDLGSVTLGPASRIAGRVVDADGHPALAEVRCFPEGESLLARTTLGSARLAAREDLPTGEESTFVFDSLGPYAYHLRAEANGAASDLVRVDARYGPAEGVVLRLRPTRVAILLVEDSSDRADGMLVEDEEGRIVAVFRGLDAPLELPEGRYGLRALAGDEVLESRWFEVPSRGERDVRLILK